MFCKEALDVYLCFDELVILTLYRFLFAERARLGLILSINSQGAGYPRYKVDKLKYILFFIARNINDAYDEHSRESKNI